MDTQVAIIGAGPAGLAAALTLSRSMLNTVVFSAGTPPRNASSPFVGALPGLDKKTPAAVRNAIRSDIEAYPYVRFEQTGINSIHRNEEGFVLSKEDGTSSPADIVLLATGMIDILPDLEGLEECWGESIINCPFCHGIEWHDTRWGIYGHRPEVVDAAEIYDNWAKNLTYFLAQDLSPGAEREKQLLDLGAVIEQGLPKRVRHENGFLTHVEMADGSAVELDCLLVFPYQRLPELVAGLNLSLTEAGYVAVDEGFRTSQAGLYAAGDLVYPGHQNTPTALHMGNMAAATIVMDCCLRQ